jgi:membrane-bound serine protease (ClpP class)
MMIGLYGLMFEFSSPGFGVPGTVGAICLLLGLFSLQMLPVNAAGVALLALGLALMAAELVTPTLGILGIGGVIAFVAGGLLLFDREVPGFGLPLALILGLAASTAGFIALVGNMAIRARRRPVGTGVQALVGACGTVLSDDDGRWWVRVQGEHWRIQSEQPLHAGERVRVLSREGSVLQVQQDVADPVPAQVPQRGPGPPQALARHRDPPLGPT